MNLYDTEYDVIVVGGGPSGTGAAISSARNGAKTLLIERCGFLGGMATSAQVPAFCPYSDGEKAVIRGIGLEILEAMKAEGIPNSYRRIKKETDSIDWVPIDPEVLKRVLDNAVISSGSWLLLHTYVVDTIMDSTGNVRKLAVENKEGRHEIACKRLIDCTGDADLVARAGGECEYGDEQNLVQGVTLCFRLANVDYDKLKEYFLEDPEAGNLNLASKRARENGEFPLHEKRAAGFTMQYPGMVGLNFGHIYEVNPLKAEDLTRAEVESRKMLPELLKFLRKYVPGLEEAVIASSGPSIGVRETRRIVGEYRMTRTDYFDRALFEDTIARYSYPIDIHASSAKEYEAEKKSEFHTTAYDSGESYGIPYRALLPKGLKNVLVAGRTLSADRSMHGSFRVMPCCFATGQAAGAAAAISVLDGVELRKLDIRKLQKLLLEQGAYLG